MQSILYGHVRTMCTSSKVYFWLSQNNKHWTVQQCTEVFPNHVSLHTVMLHDLAHTSSYKCNLAVTWLTSSHYKSGLVLFWDLTLPISNLEKIFTTQCDSRLNDRLVLIKDHFWLSITIAVQWKIVVRILIQMANQQIFKNCRQFELNTYARTFCMMLCIQIAKFKCHG